MKVFFWFASLFLLTWPARAYDLEAICARKEAYTSIENRLSQGILFTIDQCDGASSFILGTFHTDDPAVIRMIRPAFEAIRQSRYALFEINMTPGMQRAAQTRMTFPYQGTEKLSPLIGISNFKQLYREILKVQPGFPSAVLETYRPWAAAVLLQYPPHVHDGIPMDQKLQAFAKRQGLEVKGLETVEEQFKTFESLSDAQQIAFLLESLRNVEEGRNSSDALARLYKNRDLPGIESLARDSFNAIGDSALREHIEHGLITERNLTMASRLAPFLKTGDAFIGIGALHLPGSEGVLSLLEKQGYYIDVAY